MNSESGDQATEHGGTREARRKQALQAWDRYQQTGVHASGPAVVAWLKSWGSDDEFPPPECHR